MPSAVSSQKKKKEPQKRFRLENTEFHGQN